jgi:5,10-methylenetetrahydromethanopterin reductase
MILAELARRTSVIELGPGVAIPSLRHAMVTPPAIGTLAEFAPSRVNVAFGADSPAA